MAVSWRTPGVFWTHNDAGNKADLYAFDRTGRDLGTWRIRGAANRDWEDICSFVLDGNCWLLIADTGDNERTCKTPRLYLVPEPPIDPNRPVINGRIAVAMAIPFFYDNGCQDCESVAVDRAARTILLISKRHKPTVYQMPLPAAAPDKPLTAKGIATLNLGKVVAMDISPDGRRAVVLTYGNAVEYDRAANQTWSAAFAGPGRVIQMPGRAQGESICFGWDGKTLYLTDENAPCPLLEVLPIEAGARPRSAPATARPSTR